VTSRNFWFPQHHSEPWWEKSAAARPTCLIHQLRLEGHIPEGKFLLAERTP
jgi:hypothetical protein